MKTSKKDIQLLKSKHRIELVMQATGENFEADLENSGLWRSNITSGLTVDIRRQMYEIKKPGMEPEAGDVFAWLQTRFKWSFPMAINYLIKRAPDPIQEVKLVKTRQLSRQENGFDILVMDDLQKRALDLWSGAAKYFDKSSDEVLDKMRNYPKRFKAVADFGIEKCANCEKRFNWEVAGTIAYAQEEEKIISVTANNSDKDLEVSGCIQADGWEEVDRLFIDTDFCICEECMRGIYAPRYAALKLVHRSARRRKETLENERRQYKRELAEEERRTQEAEQERIENESP